MLITKLPTFFFTNDSNIVNPDGNKLAEGNNIRRVVSSSEKVKNLSKNKNIKKSAKSNKHSKTIANKDFKTDYLTLETRIVLT